MADLAREFLTLRREVAALKAELERRGQYRNATVISAQPLTVLVDGSETYITGASSLVSPLSDDDRVEVRIDGTKVTVTGLLQAGGASSAGVPPGTVVEYAGNEAPPGWLVCDGRQLRATEYPALYAVIGTRYGGAGGMFALPDHRGRVGVGYNQTNSYFNHLGKLGGSSTHTLTVNEMPRHDHYLNGGWGAGSMGAGSFRVDANNPRTRWTNTGHTGGNQAHNNLQPYITVNFIIKI